jgi:hypothetical protein
MNAVTQVLDQRLVMSSAGIVRAAAWPLAILLVVSHVAWGDPTFPPEALMGGGLLGAAALIACAYARPGVLPLLPIALLRFYFAMGLPMFQVPRVDTAMGRVRISQQTLVDTSVASVTFAAVMLVVACLMLPLGRRVGDNLSRLLDRQKSYTGADTVAVRLLALVLICVHTVMELYSADRALLGPFTYLAYLAGSPEISLGLLFWDAHVTRSSTSRLLAWIAVVVISFEGLASGMLGSALLPWIVAMLQLWVLERRVPGRFIISSVLIVLVLNPAKVTYRQLSWRNREDISLGTVAKNWGDALVQTYSVDNLDGKYESAATGVASRMSTLMQVIHIFEWVPARIPHAGPRAWIDLPLTYVPRLFWPDKPSPTREFNQRYTTTFRLQTAKMVDHTTLTLPSVGDGYWRLGWLGIVLEAIFIGVALGIIHGLGRSTSRALTIIGTSVMLPLAPESHVLGTIAGLPRSLLVVVGILMLASVLAPLFAGAQKTKLPPGIPTTRARIPGAQHVHLPSERVDSDERGRWPDASLTSEP